MSKPFLVIKQHLNGYNHQVLETVEEALKAVNPSDEFPGEYVTVYNLETNKYVHIEHFPGITHDVKPIIDEYKAAYNQ